MFWLRNKKVIFLLGTLNISPDNNHDLREVRGGCYPELDFHPNFLDLSDDFCNIYLRIYEA